jgi:hypothetical protein
MTPQLSVVATSRNDEHGGHLLARMRLFVEGLAEQAERFRLPVELILVEWNPPAGRPPLAEALRWQPTEHFQPQIVTVPPEVHGTLPNAAQLPLFQMIGKNVGIRRAKAPFVLATNIDILFSDELFAFLQKGLKPGAMYRVDRHDVQADLGGPTQPTPDECRALPVLREHRIDGMRYPNGRPPVVSAPARRERSAFRPSFKELTRVSAAAWDRVVLPKLHTSGCGDFTLTSREIWFAMRGYPEWPIFSWHLDGVVLYQAYAGGVEMVNLPPPMVAYHLEHGEGSGWTPESQRLWERLDAAGIPFLSTPEYRRLARKLVQGRRGYQPINGGDWGLASVDFANTQPRPSSGETSRQ